MTRDPITPPGRVAVQAHEHVEAEGGAARALTVSSTWIDDAMALAEVWVRAVHSNAMDRAGPDVTTSREALRAFLSMHVATGAPSTTAIGSALPEFLALRRYDPNKARGREGHFLTVNVPVALMVRLELVAERMTSTGGVT